jgi:protein gp37
MGENSAIAWTDHTFNPWIGCTKVSTGAKGACEACYAEAYDARWPGEHHWGPGVPRRRTSPDNWKKPLKWHRELAGNGARRKVFCASLADVFDNEVDPAWRADLWTLIRATPGLRWIILTKRPGNIRPMLPADWGNGYPHVGLVASAVTQEELS